MFLGFKIPLPNVDGVLTLETGVAMQLIGLFFRAGKDVVIAGAAAPSHLPVLKSGHDLLSGDAGMVGPDGHGRSPGKETAKGLAKKFSVNEKLRPPYSSAGSSPGRDPAAGWSQCSSIDSMAG